MTDPSSQKSPKPEKKEFKSIFKQIKNSAFFQNEDSASSLKDS